MTAKRIFGMDVFFKLVACFMMVSQSQNQVVIGVDGVKSVTDVEIELEINHLIPIKLSAPNGNTNYK